MNTFSISTTLNYFFILILITAVFTVVADARKAPSSTEGRPDQLKSFVAPLPSDEIMKIIIRFAQQTRYEIENVDPSQGYITLSRPVTLTSWGFFYPIYLTSQADHSTLVEVGIKSKAILIGPIVNRHHERCTAGIFAAIFAHT